MLPYFEKTNLISNEDVKFLENLCKSSEANFVAYDTVSGKRDGNLCWDMDLAYLKDLIINVTLCLCIKNLMQKLLNIKIILNGKEIQY